MKTIYISGPIRGKENGNKEAFDRAKSRLEHGGNYIVSPLDLQPSDKLVSTLDGETLAMQRVFARMDLEQILKADAIYMLDGWETSIGARAEHAVAVWIGLDIIYEG